MQVMGKGALEAVEGSEHAALFCLLHLSGEDVQDARNFLHSIGMQDAQVRDSAPCGCCVFW
jgi:hypothetical protein